MSEAEKRGPEKSPEVAEKATRRRFPLAYKQQILAEADQCTGPGELGALLRREGLYSSTLSSWRRQRKSGTLMAILDQIKAAADTTRSSDDLLAKSNVQLELEEQLRSEVSPSSPHFKFGSSEIVRELKRQAIEDSTLDVNDGGTLDPNADSTLDVNDGSTLGATNASKYFSEGISKQRFLETVIRMGGAKKMYFDTIFIESCKSELPRTSIKVLKSLDRLNIGTLFVSDAAGLRYETIDYAKLFANSDGRTFSDSLNSFMRQVQKEHAKEGLPKVDR